MARSVVVVGGGVAGLVAARELAAAGDDVLILEAAREVGGALAAGDLGGVTVDLGAEAYGVTRPETAALIDELGLADQVISPRRSDARLLLPDGLFAMPPALLGVPTDLGEAALVAVVGAAGVAAAARLDAEPVAYLDPQISLGALVRSRMGDVVVERLLTPVVGGVHAAHPDSVEADAVLPGLVAATSASGSLAGAAARMRAAAGVPGAAIAGLRGGMSTLVAALTADASARGVRERTDDAVRSIARTEGGGWQVTTVQGLIDADSLVIAVDAPAASHLLASEPGVSAALGAVAVGDVALVALVVESDALDDDPVGSGVLVAPGHPRVRAKAMTHASAKWDWIREAYGPGRHLVRLSYGRDGVIDEPLDDLPSIAVADLREISGAADVEVVDARVVRWSRSLVHPSPGHRSRVAAIRAAADAVPWLAVVGAGLGGNGLAGTIATARTAPAQLRDA